MRLSLDIPEGEKQKTFIEHLNSCLRREIGGYSGQAYYKNGNIFNVITGSCKGEGDSIRPFEIKFMRDKHGILRYAEFKDDSISFFLNKVLVSAFSDRRTKFLSRDKYFYIGPSFDGEYWIDGIRVAPLIPKEEQPFEITERVIAFDSNVFAIDQIDASEVARERSAKFAARLSLLLDIGLYREDHSKRWVVPEWEPDGLAKPSVRLHLGFHINEPPPIEMPGKGQICQAGRWLGNLASQQRNATEFITFPKDIRKVLKYFSNTDLRSAQAFDGAARLYQLSLVLGRGYPTVSLAYRAAAVDAASLGSEFPGKFKNFMLHYGGNDQKSIYAIKYLYEKIRNCHFHAGLFERGEYSKENFLGPYIDKDLFAKSPLGSFCMNITRKAIINWVIEKTKES